MLSKDKFIEPYIFQKLLHGIQFIQLYASPDYLLVEHFLSIEMGMHVLFIHRFDPFRLCSSLEQHFNSLVL